MSASGAGVMIKGGACDNRIGTHGASLDDAGERNVISANVTNVNIEGAGTSGNIVAGNFIGTVADGTAAMPHQQGDGLFEDGVELGNGASSNWIGVNPVGGTDLAAERNVISGNGTNGIEISGGSADNVVAGDLIGTDLTGTVVIGNAKAGVAIDQDSPGNTIGGTSALAGNLITGNDGPGVVVTGNTSIGNAITGDRIFANTGQAIDLGDDGVSPNAASPGQGPNDFQDYPIIAPAPGGGYVGTLSDSEPDTTFLIQVYASAGIGPGGAGELEDPLGSLEVTTDATGQATFAVPSTAPAGLPFLTATATDPQGNTSEASSWLPGGFQAQSEVIRLAPGQTLSVVGPASGDIIALQDSIGAASNPPWILTLTVSTGTLTLSSTAGLVGSGDGTSSLYYSGTLSALDAALDGMTYTTPQDYEGSTTVSVRAYSALNMIEGRFTITSGVFFVTTTADAGPGSLRQAILDSNVATGGTNTIDFAIPGTGVRTIDTASALPESINPLLIDGTTQPGYSGTALIAVAGQGAGDADPLTVGPDVTLRGLVVQGYAFPGGTGTTILTVKSVPFPQAQGGIATYPFVAAGSGEIVATVQAVGTITTLSLLDAEGHVLMQSDGQSTAVPADVIDLYIAAGTYTLQVQGTGSGSFTLMAMMMPSATARQAPARRGQSRCPRDRRLQRRRKTRPGRRE